MIYIVTVFQRKKHDPTLPTRELPAGWSSLCSNIEQATKEAERLAELWPQYMVMMGEYTDTVSYETPSPFVWSKV